MARFCEEYETIKRGRKQMKCTKCHHEMIRKQELTEVFYYECPNCHNTVGKVNRNEKENKEKKE